MTAKVSAAWLGHHWPLLGFSSHWWWKKVSATSICFVKNSFLLRRGIVAAKCQRAVYWWWNCWQFSCARAHSLWVLPKVLRLKAQLRGQHSRRTHARTHLPNNPLWTAFKVKSATKSFSWCRKSVILASGRSATDTQTQTEKQWNEHVWILGAIPVLLFYYFFISHPRVFMNLNSLYDVANVVDLPLSLSLFFCPSLGKVWWQLATLFQSVGTCDWLACLQVGSTHSLRVSLSLSFSGLVATCFIAFSPFSRLLFTLTHSRFSYSFSSTFFHLFDVYCNNVCTQLLLHPVDGGFSRSHVLKFVLQ